MAKIKILHVTSAPHGIGGVERLLLDMAGHYDSSCFIVWHCNLFDQAEGTGVFPTALKETGLPYLEIKENRWYHIPKIVRRLIRFIRQEKVNVLHLHMLHATIIGGLVGLFTKRARIVVTKHYTYAMLRKPALRIIDKITTNRADALIAISKYIAGDLIRNGAAAHKVTVIHNGIDVDAFDRRSAESTEQFASIDASSLIGCVGHLHTRKGHEYLIGAMPEIIGAFPSARLILIGEGPERERLDNLRRSLGVDHAISMLGFLEDVPGILGRFDVYIHPSLEEPFGIAILEAMAASKPVIASDVEGIPEVVVQGVTGLLVPPRDSAAIARTARTLLESGDLRTSLGHAGRARVMAEFDIRRTVRSYERFYRDVHASEEPLPNALESAIPTA